MSRFNKISNETPSKIIGIQFSILSPDEIRKASVAEITTRDTYVNNKPVIGGLFDPRMGVSEAGLICPTDGLDYMSTPGYFGHINLAQPVYYVQYLSTVMKILRCVCCKCSKLLISKTKYCDILDLDGSTRWKMTYDLASKKKRCGEDTEDGCGYLQPLKIKKIGLGTLVQEWKNDEASDENNNIVLSVEEVIKIFKRISDEDVHFMGFSPIWSRPDWMICQTFLVAPPSVRPSVKRDAQQRSEDDLTHNLVSILKHNKLIQDKINNNGDIKIINSWTVMLQYHIATQVDNKIPGVPPAAQRSGRPFKSIKDRLTGKGGRMRGNLMAKRVDFSARSVITADPNISIRELGVPMKIAKNLTKPVIVNEINREFLTKLIRNGPDIYPGAKILEKSNGESITLKYIDRQSIILQEGDIIHRHMMNGDAILFNRQPTLHRMSMMSHIVRVMEFGDTFRMNVADTKPYNADFDGDEMNLHMPQSPEAEAELRHLAAVPYQIISPANNKSIIGIFQDSLLGCYLFTQENIYFTQKEAMNLLMKCNTVNETTLFNIGKQVSNFDILSQIMPPLSIKYKTKSFNEEQDNIKTANTVLEIKNGAYIRGQIDKDVLAAGTKGLLQRICNDYGNMAASNFIDNLQDIVTEYMKHTAFSVGISDLISDEKTNEEIIKTITAKKVEVKNLIDQVQLGLFENSTGKTNQEEFETQINNILNNVMSETGKIGLKSLGRDNRFVTMVNAGSKGSDLNISFMVSCLGQQNVDGKRIPYGFEHRTLPHFTKFDDSPAARGFVESSYINGLSPQEVFFHAMGGRVGLIDTAVKTSSTGYIQRRLVKGLEDLKVSYDNTVRNSNGKIVQFVFGEDGIDTIRVETQQIPIVGMSSQEIYDRYALPDDGSISKTMAAVFTKPTLTRQKKQQDAIMKKCKQYTDFMISVRKDVIKHVFKNKPDKTVSCPVAFSYIIQNIQGQLNIQTASYVDITMLEAFELIEHAFEKMEKIYYAPPTLLFKILYYYYLSPKDLLIIRRFNKTALIVLLETIIMEYKKSIIAPGEMVGMIAGQSIGEVSTQMSVIADCKIKTITRNKKTGKINFSSQEIGPLIDGLIKKLPEKTFSTGHYDSVETSLDTLENEYFIIGVSTDEKIHWNKISHVSRHPVNGKMMKIKTRSGRIIDTTTSHSHLVRCPITQTVVPIVGATMTLGMRIPVAKHIENNYIQNTIKINNTNIQLDYQYGYNIAINLISKKNNNTENINNIVITEQIPDIIFISPLECKIGFIKACITFKGHINNNRICILGYSSQFIKDIALLLNYFDIFANIQINETTKQYKLIITKEYYEQYKKHFGLIIYNKNLTILNKEEEINDELNNNKIDMITGLNEIITECILILELENNSNYVIDIIPMHIVDIPRTIVKKYYNIFKQHQEAYKIKEQLKILAQALNADVIWDEIVEINIYTSKTTEYVYDFTVPGNQTFMTDYGIIVHNTLNTFHFAGIASKSNVTRGVPRIEEILSLSSEPKRPTLTIYLKTEDETQKDRAQTIMYMLEHTTIEKLVNSIEICYDPDDLNTLIQEDALTIQQFKAYENLFSECAEETVDISMDGKSKWIIRMIMDAEVMLEKNITMDDIQLTLSQAFPNNPLNCIYSDYNADKLIFRIRMNEVLKNGKNTKNAKPLDQTDQIYQLKNLQDQILKNIVIRGVKHIEKVIMRKLKDNVVEHNGIYKKQDIWVLDTVGSNLLEVLALNYIDANRTFSNNLIEMFNVLGIEATRQAIYNELVDVVEFDGAYINYHNYSVLCDRMTYTYKLISIFRHGINNDNIGPIAKASFEETPEMFLKAARHGELDTLTGISANVMCGQEGNYGTNAFQLILDIKEMSKLDAESLYKRPIKTVEDIIEEQLEIFDENDLCGIPQLTVQNNVVSIKPIAPSIENDYNMGF